MSTPPPRVLWLTPDKPENISVGRQRVATHLEAEGFDVRLTGTTPRTVREAWVRRGEFDVVVGTTRAGALAGAPFSRLAGLGFVVDHIDPISQFRETHPAWLAAPVQVGEDVAFRAADSVLYVYEEERTRVERWAKRSEQTALGVDYDRFDAPDADVLERGRAHLAEVEGPIAVYVGGLEPIYHLEALLDASEYLDDWTVAIAGAGSLESTVERHAARSANVSFLGTVPHDVVPGLLHAADVGVSLVDDPHTLKVLEYGAAGLPVVQLDGRAHRRFGDRVTYTDADPGSVAEAIRAAAASDPAPLHEFVAQFDWARIAKTYRAAIEHASTNA